MMDTNRPLTMIMDDETPMPPPPSPSRSVDEQQPLPPANGERNENGWLRQGGPGKRGPWPGKQCAMAMIADQAVSAADARSRCVDARPRCVDARPRCVDARSRPVVVTQPQSDDEPQITEWCTDEPSPAGRCDNCAWSFWVCLYGVLRCCEHPCK